MMEDLSYFSMFSGIGAFEKAFDNFGVSYNLVGFSEIDKYAVKSYCAIHNIPESKNLGDITKVDETALPKNIDLITYGFPCQDISLAGKQKGLFNEDGSQTRSGLFFEALRVIKATQPRVAIAENVKNLTSKKFSEQFKIVLDSLEKAGYNNYWKVLNAKDFGIPQNRERVFIVSIRKDIDTGFFKFPEGFPLKLRLKDILEAVVDEKYYISDVALASLIKHKAGQECLIKEPAINIVGMLDMKGNEQVRRVYGVDGLSPTLNTMQGGHRQPKVVIVGNVNPSGRGQNGMVIDSENLARTITTEKGEGQKILVREATKKGYAEACEGDSINLEQPNSQTRRGRVGKQVAQTLTTSPQQAVVEAPFVNGDICRTVRASGHGSTDRHSWDMVSCKTSLRIRKLTPKECFRLMGFSDTDFAKAEAVNSNTQLYKQAGNSIVVPVVEHIIKSLFECGALTERSKEQMNIPDNYDLWSRHDAEQEAALTLLPKCVCCGEPIQDEHCFDINGELYCEACLEETFRRETADYIQEKYA